MNSNNKIYITKSRIPNESFFFGQCRDIFKSAWIINNGNYVQKLEYSLSAYLAISHIIACNNVMTALMLTLQCAGLAGKKVAVTPYT
ncbi:DegT/DnrJ/EryC1/StrS family aminotransferase [Desulfovibrio sp. ZJ200]|uniref:DegT/DnrJ/EryC1/StrS family aminotransferase n=1 Tax=Desulfovibrio sp. ZJ200 TaxID=2709792 RepID=UPI0013EDBE22|nr:DegT/DnrJ/EryC1/StrS family aminotransferase [Desulfovibrio sp. ZJ200]